MDNEYDWEELWQKVTENIGEWDVLSEEGTLIHALMDVELNSGERIRLYVRYDEINGLDYVELFTKDIESDLRNMDIIT